MFRELDSGQTRLGMRMGVNSARKNNSKIALGFLKIMPMLLALFDLTNTTLCCSGIECCWISFVGGISLLSLAFLILFSFVLGFCTYHRIFLYYIVVSNIASIIDLTVGIPISNRTLLDFHFILFGIFCFLALYFYQKSKNVADNPQTVAENNRRY